MRVCRLFLMTCMALKGDLNFPHFFCELGLKLSVEGRQQWQLLHVEKDEQVIRLGKHKLHNNKTICEVALDLWELFRGKIFVLLLGLVFNTVVQCLLFCTILTPASLLASVYHLLITWSFLQSLQKYSNSRGHDYYFNHGRGYKNRQNCLQPACTNKDFLDGWIGCIAVSLILLTQHCSGALQQSFWSGWGVKRPLQLMPGIKNLNLIFFWFFFEFQTEVAKKW
jgi:hypothetical protein